MAAPPSPSKVLSSTSLSLVNTASSPWRLKVTVEAEQDSDLFLDLAAEESLNSSNINSNSNSNSSRKARRKHRDNSTQFASKFTAVSKKVNVPLQGYSDDTAISEDSLGLNNTTGVFVDDERGDGTRPAHNVATPAPKDSGIAASRKTPAAIIVPLKGSETRERSTKRKGTPARKGIRDSDNISDGNNQSHTPIATTPKRGRGRPRKSVAGPEDTIHPEPSTDQQDGVRSQPHETSTASHIPSPPTSPGRSAEGDPPWETAEARFSEMPEETMLASEGFSIIAPALTQRSNAWLSTPRPTPETETDRESASLAPLPATLHVTADLPDTVHQAAQHHDNIRLSCQPENITDIADDVAAMTIQPGPKRRKSLRNKPSNASQSAETATGPGRSSIKDRFRELASKPSEPIPSTRQIASPSPQEQTGDVSSFRRFVRAGPTDIVPGTYDESTAYFAAKNPTRSRSRGRPKKNKSAAGSDTIVNRDDQEQDGQAEFIIPDHLLPPTGPQGSNNFEAVITSRLPQTQPTEPLFQEREETPDDFIEEGRSVHWHHDVTGGSLHSSGLGPAMGDVQEPVTPVQVSTHRLLDNEVIDEPFRPNAGKLADGSLMPVVVRQEWTNRYWAVLTELLYPGTTLDSRKKRTMSQLRPEESLEDAMDERRKILSVMPRNYGRLFLSETESSVVDAFEEHMRREIVGPKRIAGETRRMWGFSRDQVKEALIVLKISRQRRMQWVLSAGERLEDWGLA